MKVKEMKVRWGWGCVLIVLLFAAEASADKILMKNGDRFQGTVQTMKGGVLTLATDYSETIQLQTSEIKKILTLEPANVFLDNGKTIKGRFLPSTPGQIKVQAPSGNGYALIGWDQIQSINPPPEKWKGSVSLGGSRNSGNTDVFSASLGAELKRKFKKNRIEFKSLSNYSEQNKDVTARNHYGTAQISHFFTPKWYSYLALAFLNDTFRDISLRTTIGPGLGYQVWEDDKKSLLLEGGFSYIVENRREGQDEENANSRFAAKLSYRIIPQLVFANQWVIFPSLEKRGEYTLRNQASLKTDLGNGWELKLSNILNRDSNPGKGVKKDDVRWILSLGYAF